VHVEPLDHALVDPAIGPVEDHPERSPNQAGGLAKLLSHQSG